MDDSFTSAQAPRRESPSVAAHVNRTDRCVMKILIDGYNLLYAANITGSPGRGTSLYRSRLALLRQLAERLTPAERAVTTIVFDAQNAPPGLPRQLAFDSIRVLFAHRRREADDLVIELVETCDHARELTVVSSDHRIQRAAKRKGAQAIDSDRWWRERRPRTSHREHAHEKPQRVLPDHEAQEWLEWYDGTIEELERELGYRPGGDPEPPDAPEVNSRSAASDPSEARSKEEGPVENPFPPGYAEDVFDEEGGW